ncbi:hypothetical protein C1A40_03230 [Tamlana carrageenivorans]|uniref:Uncharacterized protein n=1 Tax=Pseudotamlana carrageenivorans TaxID=2069432 RepID=A0A2I7SF85_9FLAO|nr:hypothetical protein C1A40_03230 [Tamlana carrageenivorans]
MASPIYKAKLTALSMVKTPKKHPINSTLSIKLTEIEKCLKNFNGSIRMRFQHNAPQSLKPYYWFHL